MVEELARAEILRLEQERCRALVAADLDALARLVSDDVVHVHANGKADDKAAYLSMVETQIRFIDVTRHSVDVRVYGEVAVAIGRLDQTIEMRDSGQRVDMKVTTTQVWRQRHGAWQQVSFQATNA